MSVPSRKPTPTTDVTLFVIVIWAFFVLNILFPTLLHETRRHSWSNYVVATWFGSGAGQFFFLGVWSVFGPGKWLARWTVTLVLAASLYMETVVVMAVARDERPFFLDGLFFGTLLPLYFLSAQSGLGLLKVLRGWQIAESKGFLHENKSTRVQFTLVHLIVVMTAVAASFGFAQLAFVHFSWNAGEHWLIVLIWAVVLAAAGPSVIAPLAWSVLSPRRILLRIVLVVACQSVLLVAALAALAFVPFDGNLSSSFNAFLQLLRLLGTCYLAMMVTLLGVLFATRGLGFRLLR